MADVLDFIKGFGAGSDIISQFEQIKAMRQRMDIAQQTAEQSKERFPLEQTNLELENKIKRNQLSTMEQFNQLLNDPNFARTKHDQFVKDLGRPLKPSEELMFGQAIQDSAQTRSLQPINDVAKNIFLQESQNERSKFLNGPEPVDKKIDEGFNQKGQRVQVWQKPTGETYQKVVPEIVRPPESPGAANSRLDKSYQFTTGQLNTVRKPIDDALDRVNRLRMSIAEKSPQADALIAPELLTAMAGGQGSGLRMNEAEISRIVGGRTHWESIKAAVNKWKLDPSKGLSINDEQRREISSLIDKRYELLQKKANILDNAQQQLIDTQDVTSHRKILADTRKALSGVDQETTTSGSKGDPLGIL